MKWSLYGMRAHDVFFFFFAFAFFFVFMLTWVGWGLFSLLRVGLGAAALFGCP
ncbi:hypothetical protein MOQ_003244, partial [Trypanosoma cruzi marinkellei]